MDDHVTPTVVHCTGIDVDTAQRWQTQSAGLCLWAVAWSVGPCVGHVISCCVVSR